MLQNKKKASKSSWFNETDVKLYCPVVPSIELGQKADSVTAAVWCEECAFYHKFGPNGEVPTSYRREREPEKCGCEGCRYRDNLLAERKRNAE